MTRSNTPSRPPRRVLLVANLLAGALGVVGCATPPATLGYTVPSQPEGSVGYSAKPGWTYARQAVAAANPLATDAGLQVLRAGGSAIDAAIDLLDRCPEAGVATLVTPLRREEDLHDTAAVKAVLTPWRGSGGPVANAWRAIYFSRAVVPAARDWSPALLQSEPPFYWQHVGLYAYRRGVLEGWNALPE